MRGAISPFPQYAFVALCSVKAQGQIHLLSKCKYKRQDLWCSNILLTYLLSPWCRILFEKLIVTHLVKKYPAFLWNPKVHYRVHKSPPLDPILSQPNPVRPIHPHLPKVQLNVILLPTSRSFQWSLTFGLPNQNPVNTSPLPHACHMSYLNKLHFPPILLK
jgi:hypothetical protein